MFQLFGIVFDCFWFCCFFLYKNYRLRSFSVVVGRCKVGFTSVLCLFQVVLVDQVVFHSLNSVQFVICCSWLSEVVYVVSSCAFF